MEKEHRNLSGIYMRHQNKDTDKWENVCFEDLPEDEQDKVLDNWTPEQVKSLTKMLANTLNNVGTQFNLQAK